MSTRVKIGLTGISFHAFWGFTEGEYRLRVAQMRQLAAVLGADVAATPTTFEDAEGALAAAQIVNATDLAVIDVAAYPEGKASLAFFDAVQVPLVLWSRNESVHGTHIGHNSFCGANFLAGNLALCGLRFRAIHGELDHPQVTAKLRTAVRLIGAAKACAGAKIGLFGEGIVPKFHDINITTKNRTTLKNRYGIEFINVPIKELVDRAASYPAEAMAEGAKQFGKHFSLVTLNGDAMDKQARILRAVREMSAEGGFSSIAIRCWPELQTLYAAWPCPSLSVLNDLGVPAACEGDPGGALDMLLMSKLSGQATTLLDAVDWDDQANTFAIWHCGPTAVSWADGPTKLLPHNVDGRTAEGVPASGLPGIVDMDFAPGQVTLIRTLGALDDEFVLEGEIICTPERHICGSFGTVAKATAYGRQVTPAEIRETILMRSLPHHYTAAHGHVFS